MTDTHLAEIREREQAATPGPWEWNTERFKGGWSGITGKDNTEVLFPNCCNDGDDGYAWFEDLPSEADAAFIANARADIPYLLSTIDRLTAENARLTERLAAAVKDMRFVFEQKRRYADSEVLDGVDCICPLCACWLGDGAKSCDGDCNNAQWRGEESE